MTDQLDDRPWILRRFQLLTIRRIVVILGVILGNVLIVGASIIGYNAVQTIDRLSTQAARRSPTTEYNVLTVAANECRDAIRDAFFAHVALGTSRAGELTPEQRSIVQDAISYDEGLLRQISMVCPYPTPPRYTQSGDLIEGPHGGVPVDKNGHAILPPIPNVGQALDDLAQNPTTPPTTPLTAPARPTGTIRAPSTTTTGTAPATVPPTTGTTYPSSPAPAPEPMILPGIPLPAVPCSLFIGPLTPPNCQR